ncbi:MAG: hypothetical protein ABI855_19640 [Bacteroidota bacterium]
MLTIDDGQWTMVYGLWSIVYGQFNIHNLRMIILFTFTSFSKRVYLKTTGHDLTIPLCVHTI